MVLVDAATTGAGSYSPVGVSTRTTSGTASIAVVFNDVNAQVTTSRVASWHARSRVTVTVPTNWHTYTAAGVVTRSTTWNQATPPPTAARSTTWHTRAQVRTTTAVGYSVGYGAGYVGASSPPSRFTLWNTRRTVPTATGSTWHTRRQITTTRAASWHVRSRVAVTRQSGWLVERMGSPTATAGIRLRVFDPAGDDLGVLPTPQNVTVAYPLNDVGGLRFSYATVAPRAALLGQPVEVAVEVTPDSGITWVEPHDSRFVYANDAGDPLDGRSLGR